MTRTSGTGSDDNSAWQRPQQPAAGPDQPPSAEPAAADYPGPPPTVAPPPGWRLPTVTRPAPARALPAQDAARLDAEEQAARTLTYGVAMVAGAIMLILLLLICGRLLF